jgi:anti-sigma B factor antagonist
MLDGERCCRLWRWCPAAFVAPGRVVAPSRGKSGRRGLHDGEPAAPELAAAAAQVGPRATALIGAGSFAEKWLTVTALPSSDDRVLVLRVVGELDLATVGRLQEYLHEQLLGAYRGVVLDCTEMSFLAACGIGLLVEIADQARAEGMELRLVAQSRVVLRALEVTGVDQQVPRAATVAEAVAQCST